ncbi:nucleoid occlusion protein [Clostridia bacterium]|nr:nucleoid occlusion protein [Clostridia bacterium]
MFTIPKNDKNRVLRLNVNEIVPNPGQPRLHFEAEALKELAESIKQLGIVQPLTVRRIVKGYELVAGERRLRAARMAGLKHVPCIVLDLDERASGVVALVENLQRRDLDCFEEAEGIRRLIQLYGLSQEEAARKLGKSQSAVANKLRLLRLDKAAVEFIRHHGLTERHARALLRLTDADARRQTLDVILRGGLNVAQTEAYIEKLLEGSAEEAFPPPADIPAPKLQPRKPLYIVKDVRVFLNSITHAVDIMKESGIPARMERDDEDGDITLTIRIPNVSRETTHTRYVAQSG